MCPEEQLLLIFQNQPGARGKLFLAKQVSCIIFLIHQCLRKIIPSIYIAKVFFLFKGDLRYNLHIVKSLFKCTVLRILTNVYNYVATTTSKVCDISIMPKTPACPSGLRCFSESLVHRDWRAKKSATLKYLSIFYSFRIPGRDPYYEIGLLLIQDYCREWGH